MQDDLKEKLLSWSKKIGRTMAERKLYEVGISSSTAQKLLAGTYLHDPKSDLMIKIGQAMKGKAS